MTNKKVLGLLAALAVAGGLVAMAAPAEADHVGVYVNPGYGYGGPPPGPDQCWRWSYRFQRWVWACASPQYYPYYTPPGPVFGFSFGTGPYYYGRHRYYH